MTRAPSSRHERIAPKPESVPEQKESRQRIHTLAASRIATTARACPPKRIDLERTADELLREDALPTTYRGYAMIALNNAFWKTQFAAIPFRQRILLLPRCLEAASRFRAEAEALGYRVLIAEGTPQVLELLLSEDFEAVLGVACLDSLDKAFARVSALGVPNMAVPLLVDGCKDTRTDEEALRILLQTQSKSTTEETRTYIPLLRKTQTLFEPERLLHLLGDAIRPDPHTAAITDVLAHTESHGTEWIRTGGKRLRPFVTLAAYAAGTADASILKRDAMLDDLLPDSACRVALAIETLHKASLVHDDIEDNDPTRYGHETLHKRHGIPVAINIGDWLIGLGYRLIATERHSLGGRAAADILYALADSHLRLCRGQGAELVWWKRRLQSQQPNAPRFNMKPIDALSIYAAKTGAAFEAALYAGLRMADTPLPTKLLRSYARSIGVGFQILNDLAEWELDETGNYPRARDALAARPTLLHCFLLEAAPDNISALHRLPEPGEETAYVQTLHTHYEQYGVFEKAHALIDRYYHRALATAQEAETKPITELLSFLADVILRS